MGRLEGGRRREEGPVVDVMILVLLMDGEWVWWSQKWLTFPRGKSRGAFRTFHHLINLRVIVADLGRMEPFLGNSNALDCCRR